MGITIESRQTWGARYGRGAFWPEDPGIRAPLDMWAEWARSSLYPPLVRICRQLIFTREAQRDMRDVANAAEALIKLLPRLEEDVVAPSQDAAATHACETGRGRGSGGHQAGRHGATAQRQRNLQERAPGSHRGQRNGSPRGYVPERGSIVPRFQSASTKGLRVGAYCG